MNSMLGALIGDATGAILEGVRHDITMDEVEHALTLPGGGILQVGPGQITDDGELTLSLWQAIHSHSPMDGLPLYSIIQQYATWYDSFPFDIGNTCSTAFELLSEAIQSSTGELTLDDIQRLQREIYKQNKYSQANGALMRVTAIATWVAPCDEVSPECAAEMAMQDASLSHPHPICQETNAIYVYTLVNLLRGISPKNALDYTTEFVVMNDFSPEVKHWFMNESIEIDTMVCTNQIGHVRWGFVLAFYFLRHPTISFEDAIRLTLLKGGDTDTNACIVGGMVATYQSIPSSLLRPVLQFDSTKQGHRRPTCYEVKSVIGHLLQDNKIGMD
jgi:ADP-ribosyl-[dinitrogen reductase] hydrolase